MSSSNSGSKIVANKNMRTLINKQSNLMGKSINIIKDLRPLMNLTIIPVKLSEKELMSSFEEMLPEDLRRAMNYLISKKGKKVIAKFVADLDNTVKHSTFFKKSKSKSSKGGDNSLVEASPPRRAFFDESFCTAIVAVIIGIILIYEAYMNLMALNDRFDLDLTTIGLFTNFEATLRNIPIALLQTVSKEAKREIEFRVQSGCMAPSGSTLTNLMNSVMDTGAMSKCVIDKTHDGINHVLKMDSDEIINGITLCWRFTSVGYSLLATGGTYTLRAITGATKLQQIGDVASTSLTRRRRRREISGGKKKRKSCKNNIKLHLSDFL